MSGDGGSYAELIGSELQAEQGRKALIDTRATSVVTNSSAIVAIVAALAVFLTNQANASLPWYGSLLVVLALIALAGASFAGIMAGRIHKYQVTSTESMSLMARDYWSDDENFARQAVAKIHVTLIKRLREVNAHKTRWLHRGWWCQIAALAALACVVAAALLDS